MTACPRCRGRVLVERKRVRGTVVVNYRCPTCKRIWPNPRVNRESTR